ncbi:leucyl-tRNA synthetase [Candidatus Scalindua japonica]|uniref:Leucyl-tRNA synthetase n=1 Tax=Candidatus Scalindua japonica TaxID=1284222 RepID=A0A286TUW7_9BACT|nr:hypothetical protein [Candidatus Scalindua japonica]GAX59679.1 leucyl-tRNA synthetase [Candidatus Scalindua japonica]
MSANIKKYDKLEFLYLVLRLVTALIGIHALILGLLNWFFTDYWLKMLQMPITGDSPFWPKQSGAMHVGLAFAYGLGAIMPRYLDASLCLIIISKSIAVLFLYSTFFMHGRELFVLLAGLVDSSILIVICIFAWRIYQRKHAHSDTIQY